METNQHIANTSDAIISNHHATERLDLGLQAKSVRVYHNEPDEKDLIEKFEAYAISTATKITQVNDQLHIETKTIPMWIVYISLCIPVIGLLVWGFYSHENLIKIIGIGTLMLFGGLTIIGLCIFANHRIRQKGSHMIFDPVEGTISLPKIGITFNKDEIEQVIDVQRYTYRRAFSNNNYVSKQGTIPLPKIDITFNEDDDEQMLHVQRKTYHGTFSNDNYVMNSWLGLMVHSDDGNWQYWNIAEHYGKHMKTKAIGHIGKHIADTLNVSLQELEITRKEARKLYKKSKG